MSPCRFFKGWDIIEGPQVWLEAFAMHHIYINICIKKTSKYNLKKINERKIHGKIRSWRLLESSPGLEQDLLEFLYAVFKHACAWSKSKENQQLKRKGKNYASALKSGTTWMLLLLLRFFSLQLSSFSASWGVNREWGEKINSTGTHWTRAACVG